MTAVSGSPTQLKSSAASLSDLAGLPDDAFDAGDLAYVRSLDRTYQLKRSTPVSPPDGDLTVSTFSGNGYWIMLSNGMALVSVPTVAALAALNDAALPLNSMVFVESVRSPFWLRSNVAAPDGISVVQAASTTRYWYRESQPMLWLGVSTFYMGGAAASDDNDGTTALTPILTLDELTRRIYVPDQKRGPLITVNVLGDITGTLITNTNVEFYGQETVVSNNVAITAVTNFVVNPYTAQVTTAAVAWTAGHLYKVSNDNGATFYATGWLERAGAPAGSGYTRFYDGSNFAINPVPGDTLTEVSLPHINGDIRTLNHAYVGVYTAWLSSNVSDAEVYVENSRLSATTFNNCILAVDTALIEGLTVYAGNVTGMPVISRAVFTGPCVLRNTALTISGDCSLVSELAGDPFGGAITIEEDAMLRVIGSVEIVNTEKPLRITRPKGSIWLDITTGGFGANYLYGTGCSVALSMDYTNSQIIYRDKTSLVATVTGTQWAHPNGAGGTTSGAFAALPSSALLATFMVGIFSAA